MKSWLIQLGNGIWLVIIFIGVPAISSLRFGSLQIASRPIWHMLALSGIGLGWIVNAVIYWKFTRTKREKRMCFSWILGYTFFAASFWAYSEKIIQFHWLKNLLLSIQQMLQ
ncbi:MAG: hypothetical protein ACFHW5_11930 [Verrucomicrobiota bacterium]|jgi:hypothetical protein